MFRRTHYRRFCLLIWSGILCLSLNQTLAQKAISDLTPDFGEYEVGFRHYVSYDSTRTYQREGDWSNELLPRPIPVSIWYPAVASTKEVSMEVLDYMRILSEEEEWEYLPDEQTLNWFYYENSDRNKSHLQKKTNAKRDERAMPGSFPTVIYAPSLMASSVENFALCEYLASYGYVVVSSPSRSGLKLRTNGAGAIARNIETQTLDIQFLIGKALQMKNVKTDQIATMGFSLGGISDIMAKMKNDNIKAMVSLDGSIRYQYYRLKELPFMDVNRVDVPFIHMAQKEIPDSVMVKDQIDPALNSDFKFFDDLTRSKAYSLKFHDLTHSYFSTMGVLFQRRDPRQDKSDAEVVNSGRWVALYTRNFLDAFLKSDTDGLKFIEGAPKEVGVPEGLITKRNKKPVSKPFSFEDFNGLAASGAYEELPDLYRNVRKEHPVFVAKESALNNLGLQLLFKPESTIHGVAVLEFATQLYGKSANLFDSLAEAYLFAGDRDKARENFEKSLELNPRNDNAINRLRELK